jgi:hypothetical protein
MDKIAKRLQNVQNMNKTQAIRAARTIVTGAENKGRQDSYARAESDGIILQKEWIATNDSRTRHWHNELDGKTVPQNKPFSNAVGLIMFPGDPGAHPSNVYNCRCSMDAVVKGFKKIKHPQMRKVTQKSDSEPRNEWISSALSLGLLYFLKPKDAKKIGLTEMEIQDATLESMSDEQLIEIGLYLLKNKRKNADLKKARSLFIKSTRGELIKYIDFIGGV